jgi:4-hydroxybenzoate polyprenyltransferase
LGATLIGYTLLQIAYNLQLKGTVILDIVAIATGFVLRAYAGAAATGNDIFYNSFTKKSGINSIVLC